VSSNRDPLGALWCLLEKRFRAAAALVRSRVGFPTGLLDEDDCVQVALIAARGFAERRRAAGGSAFAITPVFVDECVAYGRASMRNALRKEANKARGVTHLVRIGETDENGDLTFDLPDRVAHSDLRAVALDWVAKMRSRSKSPYFQRMLHAFTELVNEGFPNISVRDIADRAKVGDKELYKFKKIVEDTREQIIEGSAL